MEYQNLINAAFAVVSSVVGWVLRTVYQAIRDLERQLADHKVEVARDYVTNNDLADIKHSLQMILDKLDGKADK